MTIEPVPFLHRGHVEETTAPGKINMEPESRPLEDYFPLQPSDFQVPC